MDLGRSSPGRVILRYAALRAAALREIKIYIIPASQHCLCLQKKILGTDFTRFDSSGHSLFIISLFILVVRLGATTQLLLKLT